MTGTAPSAPVFTSPSSAGQLSNFRGSNTGADALTLTANYTNPQGSTDVAGTVRITASRTAIGGVGQASTLAWDSGWIGNPTLNDLPTLDKGAVHGTVFVYNGRIYAASRTNIGQVISAAVTAASVGPWRIESSPPVTASLNNYGSSNNWVYNLDWVISMCQVNGYAYALTSYTVGTTHTHRVLYAKINPDGTLTPWVQALFSAATGAPFYSGTFQSQLIGMVGSDGTPFLFHIGGSDAPGAGAAATTCYAFQINRADGGFNIPGLSNGATQQALPASRKLHAMVYIPVTNTLWVVGGDNDTNAQTTVYRVSPTLTAAAYATGTNGLISAWTTDQALNVARSGAALVYSSGSGGTGGGNLYVVGGSNTNAAAGGQSTILINQAYNGGSNLPAWTTGANGIGAAGWLLGAALSDSQSTTVASTNVAAPIITVGGISTAGANQATVQANRITLSTGATAAAVTGTGGVLSATEFTGTVSTYTQGTGQALSFAFLGPGAAAVSQFSGGFLDGDQVQFSIQFTDHLAGLSGPIAQTLVKIGQPPTITGTSPAAAATPVGAFTASMNYVAGAGGANQKSWRIRVQDSGQTVTLADSTTTPGGLNSYAVRTNPLLVSGTSYKVLFDVASSDVPMSGSSAAAATTTNSITVSATQPAVPTAVTAVADNTNGLVTVGWTPAANTVTSRIYFRANGTTAWTLLKDSITSVAATPQTLQLMDQIGLNQAYDYAVSGVSSGPGEGAMATAVTNVKIYPLGAELANHFDSGGYQAVLHIAGSGPTYSARLWVIPPVSIDRRIDSQVYELFGSSAPAVRYGVLSYRKMVVRLTQRIGDIAGLDTIIAQAILGSTLCYRDMFSGVVIYCALDPEIPFSEDFYAERTLRLTETNFTYAP